jgi:hypothetical protein
MNKAMKELHSCWHLLQKCLQQPNLTCKNKLQSVNQDYLVAKPFWFKKKLYYLEHEFLHVDGVVESSK